MDPILIRDMARVERPRERLLQVGADGLKDDELLALFLCTGFRDRSVLQIAQDILKRQSLAELIHLPLNQLRRLPGIGLSRAAMLIAVVEMIKRSRSEEGQPVLRSVRDISSLAVDLRDKKKEHLVAFFLNARHQLIAKEIISIGTLTASLAHPRLCAAQHNLGYVANLFMWCWSYQPAYGSSEKIFKSAFYNT